MEYYLNIIVLIGIVVLSVMCFFLVIKHALSVRYSRKSKRKESEYLNMIVQQMRPR